MAAPTRGATAPCLATENDNPMPQLWNMKGNPMKARTIARWVTSSILAICFAVPALATDPPSFTRPGVLSSIGQASDIAVVKVLLNTKLKLGLEVKPLLQPDELAGQKLLVVVVGASTKGLGAAGLDIDKEMARARTLLETARAQGIGIIALHTGGQSRRGKTTDDLITLVVSQADYTVVMAGGNKDRIFNLAAAGRGTPVVEVGSLAAVGDAVRSVVKD